ncbi:hypothetical protein C725_0485 [Pacificimonas flava]|uniref:Uncharacterized protein n=1 Tax=Pacificimonas flava TaxID=1234595 RepID=M2SGP5_9SPHN|nr:hypothetical protein C725_0485 [Pacificimonas flava]
MRQFAARGCVGIRFSLLSALPANFAIHPRAGGRKPAAP